MKLLVTSLSKRSTKTVHAAPAAPPAATRRKLPATATAAAPKPATKPKQNASGEATSKVLIEVLCLLLKPLHKPELLQNISPELLKQSKKALNVRIYAIDKTPVGAVELLRLFPGSSAQTSAGSRAIVGRSVKQPIILIDWDEIQQIATVTGVSVESSAESLLLHELGHAAGANIYLNTSKPDAAFLSEEFGWQYGQDLHQKFGRSSRSEFQKVAAHCLQTHQK
ncbi:hypothetical protein H6F88_17915 [Oculatella sp. FACHB-28]|uniref:hypothetical protein n=1 Tax=Oculatella sp. FACHB-28 TaxID=2692845 RepID=UPI001684E49C|nr:hypothetical protein [Oculatella sp. FACHB-28]MBD2057873.1 hypothetical protein [Oculatella sp. FACHB-28]